jgi:hypothetical protein
MCPDQFRAEKSASSEGEVSIRTRRDGRGARKRSCQSSMYRDESLIAPEALPAKLLSWNVTLPCHPPFPENRVSSTSSNHTITLRILSRRRCTAVSGLRPAYVIYCGTLFLSCSAPDPDVCAYRICIHDTSWLLAFQKLWKMSSPFRTRNQPFVNRCIGFSTSRVHIQKDSPSFSCLRLPTE